MAIASNTVWECRTTGNANNGGGFYNRLPGVSVDYSQQNASQLSITDLVGALASVTVTSVIGGFTPAMVGNIIQIRAGVNFTTGFYEIVQFNSANSVNLDRVPTTGAAINGLAEVGGSLASIENTVGVLVNGNVMYVKSGTYNHTATIIIANTNIRYFGYDTSRTVIPTANNRPLLALGGFHIENATKTQFENFRLEGSGRQLILGKAQSLYLFNCYFRNTNNAGIRACIYYDVGFTPFNNTSVLCEFEGTAGADSRAFEGLNTGASYNHLFAFCFFHDLSYAHYSAKAHTAFFKCTFARMGVSAIHATSGAASQYAYQVFFCSFYNANNYHVNTPLCPGNFIYGNTFQGATLVSLRDSAVPNNEMWYINNNDFWLNGANVQGCSLDLNNIGLDPLFVNPAGNDFSFGPGSPNIDQPLGIRLGV